MSGVAAEGVERKKSRVGNERGRGGDVSGGLIAATVVMVDVNGDSGREKSRGGGSGGGGGGRGE